MRSIVAILAISIATAACATAGDRGDDSSTTSTTVPSSATDHPMGGAEVVLRVSYEGGFVPIEFNLTNIPAFTLYGDGTILVPGPQLAIYPGPALPNVQMLKVSEERVQEIIDAARSAGIEGGDRHYGYDCVADASTAVFTLNAGGGTTIVSAYALGIEEPGSGPDISCGIDDEALAARAALYAFSQAVESVLFDGTLDPPTEYTPQQMRVYVSDELFTDPDLPQAPADWPLGADLATFGAEQGDLALRCGIVEGDDLDDLLAVARQANQLTPWLSDGAEFALTFRPLLPDESGC
jgi:hypothetical protein